ncbi:response regulator transcription factor [Pararobbsia silviterrae]|uniref:DNA-binding response regulator n=1 Tax=Pararobbsia silviterrae TaxID=1792498 RepID=A0A494X8U4_9BURK|nr:response regulator transcription factor [Pararobbsia silviterrae]RKP47127.1 DNA-binding response regulator [Pararobbsia silviterrae]
MVKLIIVDDHAIVRRGLRRICETDPNLTVSAEASSGAEALAWLGAHAVDVVLLDLTMPGMQGMDLIKHLVSVRPAPRILVLSMHAEAEVAARALRVGAHGYLTKDADPDVLITAVHKVASGGKFIDPMLAEALVFAKLGSETPTMSALTDREFEVFRLLASGASVTEIAERFSLSAKTISTHKTRLMQKLGLRSNADIVRLAMTEGLVRNDGR